MPPMKVLFVTLFFCALFAALLFLIAAGGGAAGAMNGTGSPPRPPGTLATIVLPDDGMESFHTIIETATS